MLKYNWWEWLKIINKTKKIYNGKITKNIHKIFPEKGDAYFYYEKYFNHPLIKHLHVIVSDDTITVFGKEPINKVGSLEAGNGHDYVIMFCSHTEENLNKIIGLINGKSDI